MSRRPALLALLLLGLGLAAAIAFSTPWQPLGAQPPGGGTRPSVAADFTAAEQAREESFHRELRPPAYAGLLGSLAVTVLLGFTPRGARLVELVGRPFGGGTPARLVAGTVAVTALGTLVALPFQARSEVVLRRYGLSTQGWGSWLTDVVKGYGIGLGVTLLALTGFLVIVRKLPRTWWAGLAVAAGALVVVGSFVYPVVLEPAFNRFTPLAAGPLRDEVLALARTEGVQVDDVLVADASRRTTSLNAYVSGFGSTRRIVLYDTLLKDTPDDEIRLIVAHELGHAARGDVLRGTLIGALGAGAAGCLVYLVLTGTGLPRRAGLDPEGGLSDPRAVPLLLALVAVGSLLASPAVNLVSRRVEARADVAALDATRDPTGAVRLERTLALTNLTDLRPPWLAYWMFATHPTPTQRIAQARDWARLHDVAVPPPLVGG